MLQLLLIGGGEIGAPKKDGTFRPLETLEIDKYFVKSINKIQPNILFIPTATEKTDANHLYEQGIRLLYEKLLNCTIDTLYFSQNPSKEQIKNKLSKADAVYIGGGDTSFMLKTWKRVNFDIILKDIALSGKPIAGLSAGAMCWFEKVVIKNNDISSFTNGLGVLKNYCIPHFNKKKELFIKETLAQNTSFIGIDECAAIEIKENRINIIKSKQQADAYQCFCIDNSLHIQQIDSNTILKSNN